MKPIALALVVMLGVGTALAQKPSIKRLLPASIIPGQRSELVLEGENLFAPLRVWTSFPCQVEVVQGSSSGQPDPERVTCRFQPAPEVAVGLGALRLFTTNGFSALAWVVIDDLPAIAASSSNHTARTAQPLRSPVAVDGTCARLESEFFTVNGKAGQRISLEVIAQRMDSALDSLLRITDDRGVELAYSDDDPSTGGDSRISFVPARDAVYRIELRDVSYNGGSDHRYHLRVGDFPMPSVGFPSRIENGSAEFRLFGSEGEPLEGQGKVNTTFPAWLSGKRAGANESGIAPSPGCRWPLLLEEEIETSTESNAKSGTTVTLPVAVYGRFDQARDQDTYSFEGRSKQQILIRGRTRSLGSPCDLSLRLERPDGTKLAETDRTRGDEGVLTNSLPADGVYRLVVNELNRGSGPHFIYRIEISEQRAGFELELDSDPLTVRPGEDFELKLKVTRRNYDGSITLVARRDGADCEVLEAELAAKKNQGLLKLRVPPGWKTGELKEIQVVGRAKVNGVDLEVDALVPRQAAAASREIIVPWERMVVVGVLPAKVEETNAAKDGDR